MRHIGIHVGLRWLGFGLFLIGLVGDSAVGVLLLEQIDLRLFLLHIPFVLIWALGINAMNQQEGAFSRVNRWGAVALLLGFLTFPGFGALAYSIGLVLANFFRREAAETTLEIAEQTLGSISRTLRASRTLDLKVSPLVDVLHDSDLESKRTAITLLSRHATPEAIQVLRQLLSDPHPQIRSDASIALTRIEDELSKKLNAALEQWTADSTNPEHAVRLADAYYDYACSNLLDEVSERIYLEKARDLIQQVTAQSKSEAEQWMKLARIRQRLGEVTRALRDVSTAHQRSPQALEAYLLAMELAFSVGDWKRLTALAREGVSTLPAAPEAQTSLSWWANLPAEQHTGGIVHG